MSSQRHTFVGFGFGAIQSGLFLAEAHGAGSFQRLVVAEVNADRVDAVRGNGGGFAVNVATADGREIQRVTGVEIFNPTVEQDRIQLEDALAEASAITTALPSIDVYGRGTPSVSDLIGAGVDRKCADPNLPPAVVYTAENHNHAAERLDEEVVRHRPREAREKLQMLNTVIGKMSSAVTDPERIAAWDLEPVVPGGTEAFLVESFNRILISRITLPGVPKHFPVFEEKEDLLPFEEAKLYGHNAVHALLGYLAHDHGLDYMSEVADQNDLMQIGRDAFIHESGAALVRKYEGGDPLFTEQGMRTYAEDLLDRMVNPYLNDPVERIIRDPLRKLAWNDRLIGAIRRVLREGLDAPNLAQGARAALRRLDEINPIERLRAHWYVPEFENEELEAVLRVLTP